MNNRKALLNSIITQLVKIFVFLLFLPCILLLYGELFSESLGVLNGKEFIIFHLVFIFSYALFGFLIMAFLLGIPKYFIFTNNGISANYTFIRKPIKINKENITNIMINKKANELYFFLKNKTYVNFYWITKDVRDEVEKYAKNYEIKNASISCDQRVSLNKKIKMMNMDYEE